MAFMGYPAPIKMSTVSFALGRKISCIAGGRRSSRRRLTNDHGDPISQTRHPRHHQFDRRDRCEMFELSSMFETSSAFVVAFFSDMILRPSSIFGFTIIRRTNRLALEYHKTPPKTGVKSKAREL